MIRKYTPTSNINEVGFFDVPIKIYYKNSNSNFPEGGIFTQHLDSLKIGDFLEISGPSGRIVYMGEGVFKFTKEIEFFKKKVQ